MAKLKIFFLLLFSFPVRAETDQSLVLHWLKDFSNKVCKIEVVNKESVSRILQLVQKDILHTNFEKEGHKTTFAIIHRMWGEIIVWKIQNSHLRSRTEIQINSRSSSGGRPRYFLRQNSKCEVILARELVYSPDGRLSRLNHLNKFLNKDAKKHFPSLGEATLSGIIVEGDMNTGLAKSVKQFLFGGVLKQSN